MWVIGISLLAVPSLLVFHRAREPEYQKKSLSEWIEKYLSHFDRSPGDREAVQAIKHIGTNAVPFLLGWMLYETPRWKANLYSSANATMAALHSRWRLNDDRAVNKAQMAFLALLVLGPDVKPAIPDLIRAATDPQRRRSREYARGVMISLSGEAVPAVVACLTNEDRTVRLFALEQLGDMARVAQDSMPSLEQLFTNSDWEIRAAATNTLLKIRRYVWEEDKRLFPQSGRHHPHD